MIGVHSIIEPHGRSASETADAPLSPIAFVANARQTYSVPFARPVTSAAVSVDRCGSR